MRPLAKRPGREHQPSAPLRPNRRKTSMTGFLQTRRALEQAGKISKCEQGKSPERKRVGGYRQTSRVWAVNAAKRFKEEPKNRQIVSLFVNWQKSQKAEINMTRMVKFFGVGYFKITRINQAMRMSREHFERNLTPPFTPEVFDVIKGFTRKLNRKTSAEDRKLLAEFNKFLKKKKMEKEGKKKAKKRVK